MLSRRGRGRFALRVLGLGFVAVGGVTAGFALAGSLAGLSWHGFAATAVVGFLLGLLGLAAGRGRVEPSRREALFSVLALWLTLPLIGTLPYTIDGGMGFVNALFESMSGFTATGATALADFTQFDRGLMAWRSLSQWFGGVGIIVLFLAVFPQLAIAGRSLFNTEMPGPTEERLAPRLRNTAGAVLAVYLGLTAIIGVGFLATGMQAYDALLHAWTTVAAGGFSPQPRSFEGFTPAVQWVATFGMLLAGISFALQFRAWGGRPGVLLRDAELRVYVAIVLASGLGLALLLGGASGSFNIDDDRVCRARLRPLGQPTASHPGGFDVCGWFGRECRRRH
jgi:trk system potassium uptake protein TrkH